MKCKLFVALDGMGPYQTQKLVEKLGLIEAVGFKVNDLLDFAGVRILDDIRSWAGRRESAIFADPKLYDIPNTMANRARHYVEHRPDYLTVHAAAGAEAIEKTAMVCKPAGIKIAAVTILTSISPTLWDEIYGEDIDSTQLRSTTQTMALTAKDHGADAIICSAHEAHGVTRYLGEDMEIIVPGIRPAGADVDDQKRVGTPRRAFENGAAAIVVGRPITQAADPVQAALEILKQIDGVEKLPTSELL